MLHISAIIPTLNEAAGIARAVEAAWDAGCCEVIVVDGGSTDQTLAVARTVRCLALSAPRGRARQQNHGARHASGDVLLFLHADTRLDSGAAAQIAQAVQFQGAQAGAFVQRIEAHGRCYRLLERGNACRARWWGRPYGDQGIFLLRSLFQRVGGFPDVPLLEDVLLMRRVRCHAWPVLLPGPLWVSPRRWRRYGPLRQTLRNWGILLAAACGVAPSRLAGLYPPQGPPLAGDAAPHDASWPAAAQRDAPDAT
jgi:rSAM/selenodomain-associated transferase 2